MTILCKNLKDNRQIRLDMALEREITVAGVHIVTLPNDRCAAFCIGGGDLVVIDKNWKRVNGCQLKEVA